MQMKNFLLFLFLLLLHFTVSSQVPATLSLDGERLADIKNKAGQKNTTALQITGSVIKQADKLLSMKPVSVMEKVFTPVSGNKHDYMSQAPYFWYDSSKPKGLPYLRRDGERNPEINKITDRKYIGDLENATRMLSLAWYFSGDEKYAIKSANLIKHWFLDPEYKMNPNLDYGQAIPGINTGRGIGIIETRTLMGVADAASLLAGSTAWTTSDMAALKSWFGQYLQWLLTSKNGKDEHAAKNNHGSWYFAQAISFALFSGDTKTARQLAEESKARLDSQLTADGRQPLELERTNALGYSTMNLRAWFEVANLAEKTGVDLYNFKTSKGSGIRSALEWLLPYATGGKAWTYQQITPYNKDEFYPVLLLANDQYKDERYLTAARNIRTGESILNELLFPITSIAPRPSTHIARITEDSIILIKGTTYSFTVDTPEDKGLVSISTTAGQLLSQLSSMGNFFKQFSIQDDKGTLRNEEEIIQSGDKLMAITSDGLKKKTGR